MRRAARDRQAATDCGGWRGGYRPSSCHGIVGSEGTRRCIARGRSIVMGFGGFPIRHVASLYPSAASKDATT